MKKIYLTFDIETIVSGVSRSSNYLCSVVLGAIHIANELKIRNLKATFFISISSKQKGIDNQLYLYSISMLLNALRSFDNIKVAPHIHALGLPVSFKTERDEFSYYSMQEQRELLDFATRYFNDNGYVVDAFRPGGFKINDSYYSSLNESGYRFSSILDKSVNACFDMNTGTFCANKPYNSASGVVEFPVTSVLVKSVKGGNELLNLSPDFFTIESVKNIFESLDYVNINFHSFSIFNNRLVRENHQGQFYHNLKYLLCEMPFANLASFLGFQLCDPNTLLATNFVKWLNYIDSSKFQTFYIGE